jgi:primary-amine oxidase
MQAYDKIKNIIFNNFKQLFVYLFSCTNEEKRFRHWSGSLQVFHYKTNGQLYFSPSSSMALIPNSLIFLLLSTLLIIIPTHQRQHPLDSLTPAEFSKVRAIVHSFYPIPSHTTAFHYVGLEDPDKLTVLSWLKDPTTKTPPRQAFVIARINQTTHEITVDLTVNKIVSDKLYDGYGYPLLTFEEQIAANALPLKYAPFLESIRKRGLKIEEVVCGGFTVGWYGEERRKNRIVRVMCYYLDGTVNAYMRPVEGVTVTVDLEETKIIGFKDRLTVPIPKGDGTDYRGSKQNPPFLAQLKGITMVQPDGPSFTIDGHRIRYV